MVSKNQSGFTLIEVMVAVGVLSVVVLGIMSLNRDLGKTAKTATVNQDMNEMMSTIGKLLADKDSCTATVAGRSANSYFYHGEGIRTIAADGTIRNTQYLVGALIGKVKLERMRFIQAASGADVASGTQVELEMVFDREGSYANSHSSNVNCASGHTTGCNTINATRYITKKIPLFVDNCQRFLVYTANGATDDPIAKCETEGGRAVGTVTTVTSGSGAGAVTAKVVACRRCDLARTATFVSCN